MCMPVTSRSSATARRGCRAGSWRRAQRRCRRAGSRPDGRTAPPTRGGCRPRSANGRPRADEIAGMSWRVPGQEHRFHPGKGSAPVKRVSGPHMLRSRSGRPGIATALPQARPACGRRSARTPFPRPAPAIQPPETPVRRRHRPGRRMVAMQVGHEHGVDVRRRDPGLLQVAHQPAGNRAHRRPAPVSTSTVRSGHCNKNVLMGVAKGGRRPVRAQEPLDSRRA